MCKVLATGSSSLLTALVGSTSSSMLNEEEGAVDDDIAEDGVLDDEGCEAMRD